jgi:RND superfamily putative drug exporter
VGTALASGAGVFKQLARFALRLPWLGLVVLLATIVLGSVFASRTVAALDPGGFEVYDSEAQQTQARLEARFGQPEIDLLLLVRGEEGESLRGDPRLDALIERLDELDAVERTIGPDELEQAWGKNGDEAVLLVAVAGDHLCKQRDYDEIEALVRNTEGLEVEIGGPLAANVNAQRLAREDLLRSEIIALPLALLFLLIFFRAWLPALLPLLIGGFAVTSTTLTLWLLGELGTMSLFALNIVVFLGLGLAIDYSLFIVERFREELGVGNEVRTSVCQALATAGKTVAFSGVAVMVSLIALAWVPVVMLRSMAIAGAVVVLLTNVGALILLPCLLALLGERVGPGKKIDAQRWGRVARVVLRRPGLVCVGVTALLLLVGSPLLRMQTATTDARAFPPDSQVHQVEAALADPSRFAVDPSNTHTLLIETEPGSTIPSAEGLISAESLVRLRDYADAIAKIDGVVAVRGLQEGLAELDPEELAETLAFPESLPESVREKLGSVLDGRATVLTVLSDLPATSPAARDQLEAILAAAPPEFEVEAAGETAHSRELQSALGDHLPAAAGTVAAASFVILVFAFGAPVVSLKAVIVNVLSLTASFGALVWVFQDGRFEGLLDYESVGTIDPTVPVMMFALIFGLSMDYELFLLSRIREAYERHWDNRASVIEGLSKTGPIITTAALILIAVVASLMTGTMTFIKQLGLGMALAILVDASLIRIALVPTTMVLLGRANWWSPRWLDRFRGALGLDLREGEAEHQAPEDDL